MASARPGSPGSSTRSAKAVVGRRWIVLAWADWRARSVGPKGLLFRAVSGSFSAGWGGSL
jgi:hypothetical protein